MPSQDSIPYQTIGGRYGHWARRLVHFAILFIAIFYYCFVLPNVKNQFFLLCLLISAILFFMVLEFVRIRLKLVVFGQRKHEATHISSFAWTMCALCVVFLVASPKFGLPIVASVALADPLLGELRQHLKLQWIIALLGVATVFAIWMICAKYFHFPFWYSIIIAPVTVAAEWPRFRWIDDNALMLLVPLLVILLIHGSL